MFHASKCSAKMRIYQVSVRYPGSYFIILLGCMKEISYSNPVELCPFHRDIAKSYSFSFYKNKTKQNNNNNNKNPYLLFSLVPC